MLKFNITSEIAEEVNSAIEEVVGVNCYVQGKEWDDDDLVFTLVTIGKPLVSVKFELRIPERTLRKMFSDSMPKRD